MDSIKNTGEAFHLVPIPCELILTTPRGKGGTQMLGYLLERNLEADINLSPGWVWGRARLGGPNVRPVARSIGQWSAGCFATGKTCVAALSAIGDTPLKMVRTLQSM